MPDHFGCTACTPLDYRLPWPADWAYDLHDGCVLQCFGEPLTVPRHYCCYMQSTRALMLTAGKNDSISMCLATLKS